MIEMYVVRMTCTGNLGIRRAMAQIPSGNNERLKIFQLQSLWCHENWMRQEAVQSLATAR